MLARSVQSRLIDQGQRMSNWLFNVAQESWVPEQHKQEMSLLVQSWDKLKSEFSAKKKARKSTELKAKSQGPKAGVL